MNRRGFLGGALSAIGAAACKIPVLGPAIARRLMHPDDVAEACKVEPQIAGMVTANAAVERGHMMVSSRDYQEAFTRRPTRRDFEVGEMLRAARRLQEVMPR